MALKINTHFYPYRMVLKRRKPVELFVELTNNYPEKKLLTLEVRLPQELSLDKGGLKKGEQMRLGEIKTGEKKQFYFDIYSKANTLVGEYPVKVSIIENYKDYQYVSKELVRNLTLRIDD